MEGMLRSWDTIALKDSNYILGNTYTPLHSILQEAARQYLSTLGKVTLDLRGNQPLLKMNRLGDLDLAILCSALEQVIRSCPIGHLNLSYNFLSNQSVFYIASYLKAPGCHLDTLDLSYNDIGPEGVEFLGLALLINTSLSQVHLGGCKIGNKGGLHLASTMQVNNFIYSLKLPNTDLGVDAIIAMATMLHANTGLRTLDLSRPLLFSAQEESTYHLSTMLKMNSTLCELHLTHHSMTDTGVGWLCDALANNDTLKVLNISSNKLSRDGARHLAELLSRNPPLKELYLSHNRIEDEGLVWISTALTASNINLCRLNVDFNSISDSGLCTLGSSLATNITLHKITIWGNTLNQPTCTAFSKLVDTGRLLLEDIDVHPYVVDGIDYLSWSQ